MNKRVIKRIAIFLVILATAILLSVSALASSTVKVTYYKGNTVYDSEFVETGVPFTTSYHEDIEGATIYGWIDSLGNLYPVNASATVDKATTLYLAYGCEVDSKDAIINAVNNEYTYIRLTCDVTVNEQISLDDGLLVIDTNGHNLTLKTEGDGILGKDTGIIVTGGGSLTHSYDNYNPKFILNGLFSLSPKATYNNLFITICKDTTVTTNVNLVNVNTIVERVSNALNVKLYGNIECERLVKTNGMNNGIVESFAGSKSIINSNLLFEDISTSTKPLYLTLIVHDGYFQVDKLIGYAEQTEKFKIILLGGEFSQDISSCFPNKNYFFRYLAGSDTFKFSRCEHSGAVSDKIEAGCLDPVTLTYKCDYCDQEYTKSFPNGIGHTEVVSFDSNFIITEEGTTPGYYKYYCQKCGNARFVPFYPNPNDVYVKVEVINDIGKQLTLNIPSKELFTFEDTALISFSTEYIQYNFGIIQENIISVEIPVGTTSIFGAFRNNAPTGAFCKNPHLQKVILPPSLVNVDMYAFYQMPKLTTIVGLEHITGDIGKCAFEQSHTNTLFDNITLNAKSIGEYAFKNLRMRSVTFNSSVRTIAEGAFMLEGAKTILCEIFVEGNTRDGINVATAMSNVGGKSYNSTNQQFGALPIVFADHTYTLTLHEPTCNGQGYTHYYCTNCKYEKDDDFVPQLVHIREFISIPGTCQEYGYDADKCTLCGDEINIVINSTTNKDNHIFSGETGTAFLDENGKLIDTGSVCTDKHATVNKCSGCGILDLNADVNSLKIIQPLNKFHNYDRKNPTIIVAPTCGSYGQQTVKCLTCGKVAKQTIDPKDDAHVWTNEVIITEATCFTEGEKTYTCSVCATVSDPVEIKINKNNHSWTDGGVKREPTIDAPGIRIEICSLCRSTKEVGIPKLKEEKGMSTGLLIGLIAGGVVLLAGAGVTVYFTFSKKKRASAGYKYKFNTLK